MRARAILLVAAVALTGSSALAGCSAPGSSPSPTTTYTDAAGEAVIVDWADYPAHAGVDGDVLVGFPDQGELERPARLLLEQLRAAVSDAADVELTAADPEQEWFRDENWHPQRGNGYGGPSMLTTVNCCLVMSDTAPDRSEWPGVLAAADEVIAAAGFAPLALEDSAELRETYCTLPGGECWAVGATAYDGAQWISLWIQDATLDPTGAAAAEAERLGLPAARVGFDYGATVVADGRSAAYERAIEPFAGLKRPDATTSD